MNGTRILKAVAAVAVLALLLFVVFGWLGQYREATSPAGTGTTTTPTVDATGTAEPDDGDSDDDAGDDGDDQSSDDPAEKPTVVILIEGLNFRATPASDGRRIRGLGQGDRLELLKTEGGWHQVRADNGDEGWISANAQYTRVEGQ